jgi:hypothetical protein
MFCMPAGTVPIVWLDAWVQQGKLAPLDMSHLDQISLDPTLLCSPDLRSPLGNGGWAHHGPPIHAFCECEWVRICHRGARRRGVP